MRQLKEDNRGFSLIEVMVAIMILAIVVTPFLHSFITAANTNSKARKIHKATVLAQSVMEGFKAEELEDIALQFDYPATGFRVIAPERIGDGRNTDAYVGELRYDASAGTYGAVINYEDPSIREEADKRSRVTASIYSENLGLSKEFLGQADGLYYFAMKDVKEDNSSYDVLVKLDATAYRAGGGVDTAHQYNDKELVQLPVIDLNRDAVCIQKDSFTNSAVSQFHAVYPSKTIDEIKKDMKRVITITVERTRVGGGDYRVRVVGEYRYTYQESATAPEEEYVKTQTYYDSLETGEELRAVYLHYYPLYLDNAADPARDEIVFDNSYGVPVNFYVLKQESTATTEANEERYKVKLSFCDTGTTPATMVTHLYTNLNVNLKSGAELSDVLIESNCKVFLNHSNVGSMNDVTAEGLTTSDKQDRVFDITVSVYEEGAAASGYPEDKKLATMTGSRLN